jgi:hypothetical protein
VLNLFYRARVVTPGKFVQPALYAEDMYRPEIYGLSGGGEFLTVVDANAAGTSDQSNQKAEGRDAKAQAR